MDQMEQARLIIDEVDAQMAALFEKRMHAVGGIAAYKREQGIPIYDEAREKTLIARNLERIQDASLRNDYLEFLEQMLRISKAYQHRLLAGIKVAYSGLPGAFAEIAVRRIFPGCREMGYDGFQSAYDAVVRGECDCAVLPVENSFAGEVGQVMDLMFRGSLCVSGVYTLPVTQNLLGLPGAALSGIRTVISHSQALSQCAAYLEEHGWETRSEINTAIAAQKVAEAGDPTLAAIASAETAELYGLQILEKDISTSGVNTTKFAVFSRTGAEEGIRDDRKFILMFTVNDVAGALADAINVISSHGFNMKALRSRPVQDRPWQYYFYVEAEGDERSEAGRQMLAALGEKCDTLKIVGHYTAQISIEEALK